MSQQMIGLNSYTATWGNKSTIYCLNYTIAVININIELMVDGPIKYSSLNRRVNKVSQRFHNHEEGPY